MSKHKLWTVGLLLAGLLLAACSSSQAEAIATQAIPTLAEALPPDVALNVQNFISESLAVPPESIQIQNVQQMDWPDACLGLPQGDEVCAQAVTPGWLLTFNVNDQEYRYRVDQTGTVIRQEP